MNVNISEFVDFSFVCNKSDNKVNRQPLTIQKSNFFICLLEISFHSSCLVHIHKEKRRMHVSYFLVHDPTSSEKNCQTSI